MACVLGPAKSANSQHNFGNRSSLFRIIGLVIERKTKCLSPQFSELFLYKFVIIILNIWFGLQSGTIWPPCCGLPRAPSSQHHVCNSPPLNPKDTAHL